MAIMRILNSLGDRRVGWDLARAREGDPEAEQIVVVPRVAGG